MRFFIFGYLLIFTQFVNSETYDHCKQILSDGKFNKQITDKNNSKFSYQHLWLCSQEYSEENSEKGIKIKTAFEGIISGMWGSGDSDFSYNQANYNQYKKSYCNENTNAYSEVDKSFLYSQVADPNVIQAWENCIGEQNKGLICRPDKVTDSEIGFLVKMGHGQGDYLKNAELEFTNLSKISKGDLPKRVKQGDEFLFNFNIVDPKKSAQIKVTGKTDLGERFCNYNIPVISKITPPDAEHFKIQSWVAPNRFDSSMKLLQFQTQGGKCTVKVSETVNVTESTVSKDKTIIHVGYKCSQPDHTYNCGGGWTPPKDVSFLGAVTAEIKASNGVLKVIKTNDINGNQERFCGKTIEENLKALDGKAL